MEADPLTAAPEARRPVRDSQATLLRSTLAAIATVLVPLVLVLAAILVRARLHHDLPALLTNDSWDYFLAA
jgi:hypothetical protein